MLFMLLVHSKRQALLDGVLGIAVKRRPKASIILLAFYIFNKGVVTYPIVWILIFTAIWTESLKFL